MRRGVVAVLLAAIAVLVALRFSHKKEGRAREPLRRTPTSDAAPSVPDAAAPASAQPAGAAQEPSPVTGTVRDGDKDAPFAGARVRLFRTNETWDPWTEGPPALEKPTQETTTDAEGKFTIGHDSSPAILAVDAPGYLPVVQFTDDRQDIVLKRGTPHRVRVADPEGRGLEDAEALIFLMDGPPRAIVHAGAGGWIDLLVDGEESIVYRAPGRRSLDADKPLLHDVVVLYAEYGLKGAVIGPAGDPVEGVLLTLSTEPWPSRRTTGQDGRFSFEGLGPDRIDLDVTAPGRPARRLEVWPGDERMRIVLDAVRIRGTASLYNGGPAADAFVEVWGPAIGQSVETHADENGRFLLEGIPAGEVRIDCELEVGGQTFSAHADLYAADGEEREANLILRPPVRSRVAVRVLGPGNQPVAATLEAYDKTWDTLREVSTDDDGRAVLEFGDPPGTEVALQARCPHGSSFDHQSPAPMIGEATTVTTDDARGPETVVRLRSPVDVRFVIRRSDGSPMPSEARVNVALLGDTWSEWATATPDRCTLQCADGAYVSLRFGAPGYVSRVYQWDIPRGGDEYEIRLDRAVRIIGRVVHADGSPVEAPFLRRETPLPFSEDPLGEALAAPGETVLLIAGEGDNEGWFRRVQVPRDRETLDLGDIVLSPRVAVRGVVLGPDGVPMGGVRISFAPSRIEGVCDVTRGDGKFAVDAPPWEDTCVVVTKDGFAADPVPLKAFRDGPRTVRMEVAARLVVEGDMSALRVRRAEGDASLSPLEDTSSDRVILELPPGRFAVEAKGDGWTATREVELASGKTTRITLPR